MKVNLGGQKRGSFQLWYLVLASLGILLAVACSIDDAKYDFSGTGGAGGNKTGGAGGNRPGGTAGSTQIEGGSNLGGNPDQGGARGAIAKSPATAVAVASPAARTRARPARVVTLARTTNALRVEATTNLVAGIAATQGLSAKAGRAWPAEARKNPAATTRRVALRVPSAPLGAARPAAGKNSPAAPGAWIAAPGSPARSLTNAFPAAVPDRLAVARRATPMTTLARMELVAAAAGSSRCAAPGPCAPRAFSARAGSARLAARIRRRAAPR